MGYESLTMSRIIARGSLCLTNFRSVLFGVVNGLLASCSVLEGDRGVRAVKAAR
ncbi:hypothetical protein Droror1_Dr00015750, partial [Drosera rotundifolia]